MVCEIPVREILGLASLGGGKAGTLPFSPSQGLAPFWPTLSRLSLCEARTVTAAWRCERAAAENATGLVEVSMLLAEMDVGERGIKLPPLPRCG